MANDIPDTTMRYRRAAFRDMDDDANDSSSRRRSCTYGLKKNVRL